MQEQNLKVIFSIPQWKALLDQSFAQISALATLKGGEYSGDTDRLANFRRNAQALGLSKESIWAVYAAKHWDALLQFIKDQNRGKDRPRLEGIEGRVDDLLVYLLLFKAMLWEARGKSQDPAVEYGSKLNLGIPPLGEAISQNDGPALALASDLDTCSICRAPFVRGQAHKCISHA